VKNLLLISEVLVEFLSVISIEIFSSMPERISQCSPQLLHDAPKKYLHIKKHPKGSNHLAYKIKVK